MEDQAPYKDEKNTDSWTTASEIEFINKLKPGRLMGYIKAFKLRQVFKHKIPGKAPVYLNLDKHVIEARLRELAGSQYDKA